MHKEITCTKCPNGCKIQVTWDGKLISEISGNQCPRGLAYAKQEMFDPRRTITATIVTKQRALVTVPVRTSQPIPIKKIPEAMNIIHAYVLNHAVIVGDTVIADFIEPGINLIATRSCP
jgi:CxxC motif-containing protein